ncbi:ABC transporter ATP-binding protein [Promicromonospora sp. NPDC023805]|uniref:ABC transporter ATP-binding protein n=1 Tax=Promicromonospora sp. NPDC023805 TaxID=3154696 RepID=UPI0033EB99E4
MTEVASMPEQSIAPDEHSLLVDNVSHMIGRQTILNGVSFAVRPGASIAVQGRSGSGKSTLLSIIMGLIAPSSGSVTIAGEQISSASRTRRAQIRGARIGVVFQHAELLDELTVKENILLPSWLSKSDPEVAARRADELIERLGLPGERSATVISGGERQRTALARALINDPVLLLADEPTGALDAELREAAAELLFDIPAQTGCAVVIVTHDPAVAQRADHQFTLSDGHLTIST